MRFVLEVDLDAAHPEVDVLEEAAAYELVDEIGAAPPRFERLDDRAGPVQQRREPEALDRRHGAGLDLVRAGDLVGRRIRPPLDERDPCSIESEQTRGRTSGDACAGDDNVVSAVGLGDAGKRTCAIYVAPAAAVRFSARSRISRKSGIRNTTAGNMLRTSTPKNSKERPGKRKREKA